MITSSKSLQAKISSSNSTFIKRYVNTSIGPFPGVSHIFLAVKHLRTEAKQEPYMPLSECETLSQIKKRDARATMLPQQTSVQQLCTANSQSEMLFNTYIYYFWRSNILSVKYTDWPIWENILNQFSSVYSGNVFQYQLSSISFCAVFLKN